jgi:hypothetical protein
MWWFEESSMALDLENQGLWQEDFFPSLNHFEGLETHPSYPRPRNGTHIQVRHQRILKY